MFTTSQGASLLAGTAETNTSVPYRLISTCRMHFLSGFNENEHKNNDTIMDFMVTLCKPATAVPLKADIAAGLVKRSNHAQ